MEMRRYVRHSPAWWIVGGILALLTAGCIVLGLLAQRDSAAAEAVPIGDEIYLGAYNYIGMRTLWTIPMLTTAVTAQCRTIRPRPRSWPSISR